MTSTNIPEAEQLEHTLVGVPGLSSGQTSVRRASRWWLVAVFVLVLAMFIPDVFGRLVFDDKIDLTVDPYTFLHNIVNLWNPTGWFGYLRNQYQGFAFPTAPLFIVGHILAVPAWLVQRIWMALLVTVAFWGIVRLAEELRIGSLETRLVAGAAFALWPTLTMLAGSVTASAAPGALTAWVMIPLVRASRRGAPIRGAALSAVAILFMGGVNAADTFYALIIPALFLLTRAPSPRKRSLLGWWVVCAVLATAWWAIPLLFQGQYGFNFLPYVEQSSTTTATSSATTALSGTSVWTSYVNVNGVGWNQAGLMITSFWIIIVGAALTAATGLYGLATRQIRERRFLVISLAVVVVGALAAYWGPVGGPFSQNLLPLLNGPLAPFRSVYKLEPAIGLLLALGIADALHELSEWSARRRRHVAWRVVAGVAAVAVLLSLAAPYLMGRATNKESFSSIPNYWYKAADYLATNSPRNTALVLPAASHGEYVWGWTEDQPLEALARSPWANDQNQPMSGAGNVRMVDAIEEDLRTGTSSPGLPALLRRSGIKYIVVQNDVQWQLSDSPSPFQVHQVLEGSGLTPVAQFGPTVATPVTDLPTLSLRAVKGLHVQYPSVEIFQAPPQAGEGGTNSPVATYPASSAVLVSGGPEAVKQLMDNGVISENQAAILAGDWHGGSYRGPLFAVTDTLRRTDTKFGLLNDNSSYTYTATEQTPTQARKPDVPAGPSQILPFSGVQHQTVAVLKGAKSITVSSAGSVFFNLPEYDPANVFDGESSSGWVTGSPFGSVGEWIQINFDHPVNPQGTHIQFLVGPGHPQVTGIRVSTDRGSVLTKVSPASNAQLVNVPAGTARYLRVTFTSLQGTGASYEAAGIQTISIPGVHVQSLLKAPQESSGSTAKHLAMSFQATPVDYNNLLRSAPEPVLERQFSTPKAMTMTMTGQVLPSPGPALDALIGSSKLRITASSSFGNLPQYRPQNLIDSSAKTSWVAASSQASIRMHWPHPLELSSVRLVTSTVGLSVPPEEVLISSPSGSRLLHVRSSSRIATLTFTPLDTNQVTISFPKIQTHLIQNGLNQTIQAPVGLAEIDFPKLALLLERNPNPTASLTVPCGSGPPINIDGKSYKTTLTRIGHGAGPTIGDLQNLKPIGFGVCEPYEAVSLSSGTHQLVATPSNSPFSVSALTLKEVGIPSANSLQPSTRKTRVLSWEQESRAVAITSGPATYLEVHQNYNSGWSATLNGQTLTPIRLDGWQQGYLVPAGRGGTVQMTFTPETPYLIGLALGAVGVVVLLLIAFGVLGRRRNESLEPAGPWNAKVPLWLSIGLAAAVLFVVGGPVVLAVPALVLVGSWRVRLLPWVAFAAMTAAGIIAAVNPGHGALSSTGAFGAPAQVCALIALAAVLVPITRWQSRGTDTSVVGDGAHAAFTDGRNEGIHQFGDAGARMAAGPADPPRPAEPRSTATEQISSTRTAQL